MSNYFLNYENGQLSLNTYRKNGVYCGDDVIDFCHDIQKGRNSVVRIDNARFYLDILSDGEALEGLSQEVVEDVYNLINTL